MLFMTIYTYEPDKRNDVIRRAVEKGRMTPEGVKEVGVWSALSGGRVFRLMEAGDPKAIYEGTYAWSDLGKVEIIPVMDNDELLKILASKK
jgi:hypothetical protein